MITGLENVAERINSSGLNPGGTSKSNELGKDDFLKLLVTQLSAQDPLNPLDSQDFSAQLAQFSALEQMTNVATKMDELIISQQAVSNSSMIDLIGKKVDIEGSNFGYNEGETVNLSYRLEKNSASTFLDIFDATGRLVTTLNGNTAEGSHLVSFDGKDSTGKALPTGTYSMVLRAADDAGNAVGSKTFTSGLVTDVLFEEGSAYAIVNGEKIPAGEITRVSIKS